MAKSKSKSKTSPYVPEFSPPAQLHFPNGSQVRVISPWSKFKGQAGQVTEDNKNDHFLIEFDDPIFGSAWFSGYELEVVS